MSLVGSIPSGSIQFVQIIDTVLLALVGLAGVIAILRTRSTAWKWIGATGLFWALTGIFAWYARSIWVWKIGEFQVMSLVHQIGIGFLLAMGLLTARE